jgi:NAD(P)-dependent dehydrogenase (short-subunit alcohol dehydrogenase family)
MSVYFITGASRGLGSAIVDKALAAGHQVFATARNAAVIRDRRPEAGDALKVASLDVTDQADAVRAVSEAVAAFGRIDVIVNNAGQGLLGAVEEVSDERARAAYEVNVFGVLNVTRAVLPVLRAQRSGHIVNLSSVGGLVGSAGWGIYNSSKFAVEGFSEALSKEVAPLGIHVTIVEPGYFRTDFLDTSSLSTEHTSIDDYSATAGSTRERAATVNHAQPGDPNKAAAAIVRVAEYAEPPLHLLLGADCVALVEKKLDALRAEIGRWREISLSTGFDD